MNCERIPIFIDSSFLFVGAKSIVVPFVVLLTSIVNGCLISVSVVGIAKILNCDSSLDAVVFTLNLFLLRNSSMLLMRSFRFSIFFAHSYCILFQIRQRILLLYILLLSFLDRTLFRNA